MYKNFYYFFLFFLAFTLTKIEAGEGSGSIPHYMKIGYEDLYLNHPAKINPLYKKVIGIPAPPEWAKYKPDVTRIQNDEGFDLINITNGNDSQSETWIAINPSNPQNIIATSNDNKYISGYQGYKMNSWFTLDGGQSWTSSPTPSNIDVYISKPSTNNMTIFDPGVAFDSKGNCVYTYGFTQIMSSTTDGDNGVFAVASTNGGQSWDGWGDDFLISPIALSYNEAASPFHDRYTVASDQSASSPYKDRFYITWQRFISNPGIQFAYSDDYGESWSNPIKIGSGATQAPMPVSGPDGEVYVAWINASGNDEAQAVVLKSTNGGTNWSNTIIAQKVNSIGTRNATSNRFTLEDKQGMRVSSPPQIAVDCSNKSTRGNVYVVQAGRETSNGKYGVWVSNSTNGGSTWNKVRIDNSEVRNDMFFPSITCDPITGLVSVLYYSSQNDPENNQGVDAYLSFSQDGGNTWNVIRISPDTWYIDSPNDVLPQGEVGNVYWGDYTSITSYDGVIYPLFWMPTTPAGNYYSLDLFTAPISNKPKPVEDLASISIFNAGKPSVKLTWVNPTEDLLKRALGDYNIEIYRDDVIGNPIATINKSANPEYIDANVIDAELYSYSVKVVTADGRESILKTTAIKAGGALKPNPPSEISWRPTNNGFILSWISPDKAIDGSDIRELSAINIYVDNLLFKTVNQTQINAGTYVSEEIQFPEKTFAKVKFTAVATRSENTSESEFTEDMLVYAGQLFTSFSENFDGEEIMPLYQENGWGLTDEKVVSGPNAYCTVPGDKYETKTDYYLYFSPMVVTEANQSFIFQHICLVHSTDVAAVYISRDFGKTFIGSRWFDYNSSDNFLKGDVLGSTYERAAADLRPYIGDTVIIRMSVFSGLALTDYGWFIDDITTDNSVAVKNDPMISEASLIISPNPASVNATVDFTIQKPTVITMELVDMLGNRIQSMNLGLVSDYNNHYILNLNTVPSGTYYLRLISENNQIVRPLSIVR
ncbi:MAG: hypothetical protein A2X64_04695 [Ignavibacteria bacterium GWF2_33_9]|nr:MAG: hypothetical protein A2X64_04695 [Ignavibacteria bacterium GWF2_33_9]